MEDSKQYGKYVLYHLTWNTPIIEDLLSCFSAGREGFKYSKNMILKVNKKPVIAKSNQKYTVRR